MADIVLVHGIAQEQRGAATLESEWLPAIADGLRAASHPDLATRVWPVTGSTERITAEMAFYGDLFLEPGTMGTTDTVPPAGEGRDLAEAIAQEWLRHGAERVNPDQQAATTQLSYLQPEGHEEQGPIQEAQRSALNALARLRWFAPLGMRFAGKFVNQTLSQVTAYLTDETIRDEIQGRVAALIGPDTKAILGHSLGSVVAYEAAHRLSHPIPLLLTIGSPLGLRTIVFNKVRPQPPGYPPQVRRWVNIADRNDLVAAEPDLRPQFGEPPPGCTFDAAWTVVNGAKPHDGSFYLSKKQTGIPLAQALTEPL
ncbi:hypothetical protein N865_21705 [Intrasporangium oryzae NRRL B-24470]|uniref:Alpha/beta hydrolase n=1 Tax=Intrasporangium oryzae NRRL B-24470 TaxID=1386089 RepID=W9G6Z1_9MICO|nr:hypothetical protein [Intrasporangium oryzae]EWS99638.1 hypothetical protein N865_21705 [Intrasporangium oryzae NRRL B-24470]